MFKKILKKHQLLDDAFNNTTTYSKSRLECDDTNNIQMFIYSYMMQNMRQLVSYDGKHFKLNKTI